MVQDARAGAAARAAATGPTTLRRSAGPGDVVIARKEVPYRDIFAVEDYHLTHARFDGAQSAEIKRAAFVSGDAVTVLPYDPARGRVLLVEQFRTGPMARGDAQPWQLEAIAGRIDAGETPEVAAAREAMEEAGLPMRALIPVAQYYPSPGILTEFIYSFVGLCDLPDGAAGLFGLATEDEDIRSHIISLDALMTLVQTGEAANAPLILSALWLSAHAAAL